VPVTQDSDHRECTIPRAMVWRIRRGQELDGLRDRLEYWGSEAAATAQGAAKCLASVQAIKARMRELENGADPAE
jgi:hypothetical protein